MASTGYSFIDVAALDAVRARLLRGDAIVILSTSLEDVLWANGPGAALFGYGDIEAIMGAASGLSFAQRRQIAATPGFPRIGSGKRIMLRFSSGFGSRAAAVEAEEVAMPDGEPALMLSAPAAVTVDQAEAAAGAISGFGGEGRFAAMIGPDGDVEAATPGWSELRLDTASLAREAASGERTRRRMVEAAARMLPMGLARLADDPPRFLVVVIDEPAEAGETEAGRAALTDPEGAPAANGQGALEAAVAAQAAAPGAAARREEHSAEAAPAAPTSVPESRDGGHAGSGGGTPPRGGAAVRFVWRTDAEGRFSSISQEFAQAVGLAEAEILGRSFGEVAASMGFDGAGEIAALLERRDTWSGRMVLWPIAGSRWRVPVDLAALPAYSRDRAFEGFRGFGVARMADLVEDIPAPIAVAPPEPPAEAPVADPFEGETPALALAPTPLRRESDKVIRLAEHRPGAGRSLSPLETSAFREIGDRLKQFTTPDETEGEPRDNAGPVEAIEAIPAASGSSEDLVGEAVESRATPPLAPVEQDAVVGEAGGEEIVVRADAAPDGEAAAQSEALHDVPSASAMDRSGDPARHDEDNAPAATAGAEDEGREAGGDDAAEAIGAGADEPAPPELAAPKAAVGTDQPEAEPSAVEPQAEQPAAADLSATQAAADEADPDQTAGAVPDVTPPSGAARRPAEILPSAFHLPAAATDDGMEILARLPVPLLVHSGDTLHFANREFLDLTGYDGVEALAAAGGLDALIAGSFTGDTGETARMLRIRSADGDEIAAEGHLRSVPWRGGRALLLALRTAGPARFGDDELEDDPAELRARLAEMRAIVDTATDGLVLIEPDGSIRSISRPAEALFGFDAADVQGKPFTSLFALESQRAARDYLAGLTEPGVASVLNDGREVIGREAQGRFIPLFMTIGRLSGGGFCAVLRDITQWKRSEEELTQAKAQAERASSQKSDFLARISHEIRTPLNAIIGFSELMMDEKFGPIGSDRYRDYLRDINRSGNHVLDLVNDLLDISKIEAGEQEMTYEAVSLNETLAETVALMQPQANRERVIIRSSFSARLPEIVADLRSIRQIALNLLSNAVRYTPAGGQVIVSTAYEASGDVVMRVRDTGIGMTHAEIEQALKPFRRINALKRQRNDGTGLGLPLTKAMVEANRARFAITSTPGEGTLVEITFPSTRVLAS